MHTLFALGDLYGVHIDDIDGKLCLRLDKSKGMTDLSLFDMFSAWQQQAKKLRSGEITKEEYDAWHYNYPQIEAERTKAVLDAYRSEKDKGEK